MTIHTHTKVNAGLHVLRRRPDGYHDLETLFLPCRSFGDILEIQEAPQTSLQLVMEGGAPSWDPANDLTMKALRLLKADFPHLPEFALRLEKHAPVGAGLGGGSADAAAVLRAVNDMCGLGLDNSALSSYAATLGSDCAFFIYDTPMFGSGRGEILEPFDIDLSGYELRVAVPSGEAVSTAEAYRGVKPREDRPEPLRESLRRPVSEWKGVVVNDFEESIFPSHPAIAALKERMYADGAVYASMSGSGSAVFGLFAR